MVIVEDERKALLVVVPDDQLSLAIGRQGQNVRLASRLLGWKIDVKSQSRYANMDNTEYRSLLAVDGVDENLADRLFAAGITSAPLLAAMDIEQLMALARIDQDKAQGMQKAAAAMQPSKEKTAQPAPDVQELTDQEPVTPQEDQSIEQGG
jgi:N utilization substance protein A